MKIVSCLAIRVLMNTLCRFAAMSRPKLPLSAPFPQVIFSDAQYTILPDVSSYRYPDKTVYVSILSVCTCDDTLYLSARVIATKLILTIPTSEL